ncbi:MAG: inorganic phosphate transporter [Myxococcales bacterium]|nr:MAG: inorganic phosphate transporter [Myxococcales bacterium]
MDMVSVLTTTAAVIGLYMAWNIGANDVANAMGTSVGSGALTLRRAIVVAAVFEFCGALLVGGSVTETISKGIVDASSLGGDNLSFALGMTCSLLAAAIWLNIATFLGWPVSTTHSIVGAVIGFGIVAGGFSSVDWSKVSLIVASWIISPICGGFVGYFFFIHIRKRILAERNPLQAMQRYGPLMLFPIGTMLTLSLIYKGLKPLKLDLPLSSAGLISVGVGIALVLIATPILRKVASESHGIRYSENLKRTERVFLYLQVATASFVAFAHGSNDVANAVGPLAAVFGALQNGFTEEVQVPMKVLLLGACGIVIGLATYGYKVIATVGEKITELTPSRGFTAEFAAATTILVCSKLGLPVSTTHTLIGSVIGVGFARSVGAINTQVLRGIIASWFITVPFTAILAAALFALSSLLF